MVGKRLMLPNEGSRVKFYLLVKFWIFIHTYVTPGRLELANLSDFIIIWFLFLNLKKYIYKIFYKEKIF